MKIIKMPEKYKRKTRKFMCGVCGCEFEADPDECKPEREVEYRNSMISGVIERWWCKCPCCGEDAPEEADK